MAEIGTLTGNEIKTNRDGDREVRVLSVEITGPEDVQSIEYVQGPGEDSNPVDDSQVIIMSLGEAWKIAIALNDGITPAADLEKGEKEFYSSEDGNKKALLRLLKDGTIKMNGGGKKVAREADPTLVNSITDLAFITWVAQISAVVNGLVPGSVVPIPTTVTGKINDGSSSVEVP